MTNPPLSTYCKVVLSQIIMGILFISTPANATAPLLDNTVSEYYLKGTLEETSEFNFNAEAGSKLMDRITIVNNTEEPMSFALEGVDSSINNQQLIVFKSNVSESPNFGKWINFEQKEVSVQPKTSQEIPFQIQVPPDAFPGSYFGGISIQKKPSNNAQQNNKGFVVNVQTRQILNLTVNIAGEIDNRFKIENVHYDPIRNHYEFTITNQGNTILSFEGEAKITTHGLSNSTENTITIPKYRILPGTSITKKILSDKSPLFGKQTLNLSGQMLYFDGIQNKDTILEQINSITFDNVFFTWSILIWGFVLILVAIAIILINAARNHYYLKHCKEYVVKNGDTLISIAKQNEMAWKKLAKINKITPPYIVTTGQKILVHEKKQE